MNIINIMNKLSININYWFSIVLSYVFKKNNILKLINKYNIVYYYG